MKQVNVSRDRGDVVLSRVFKELSKAEEKFPGWPTDIVHGVAIMAEESGEAVQAALDHYYRGTNIDALKKELAQTAAMAIRMMLYLEDRKP